MFNFFRSEPVKVKLDDLPAFLLNKFDRDRKDAEFRLLPKLQSIYNNLMAIKAALAQMNNKSSPSEYANRVKEKFCQKALEALEELKPPRQSFVDLREDLLKYYDVMRIVGGVNMKEFRHLHAFVDDMMKIAPQIKTVENGLNQANKIVADSPITKILDLGKEVDKIKILRQKRDEKTNSQESLGKSLTAATESLQQQDSAFTEANEKLTAYAKTRTANREFDQKINDLEQKIENEFSGLDRPLKKFLYFGELSKHEAEKIKEYIQNPYQTFLNDKENMIFPILEALHNYKDRKVIDLDHGKDEKIKELLRNMAFLIELRSHYFSLLEEKKQQESSFETSLHPLVTKARSLSNLVEEKRKEINELKKRSDGLMLEQKLLDREILDVTTKINLSLATLDRNISLV